MEDEEEFGQVEANCPKIKQEEGEGEGEKENLERKTGVRCCQREREVSGVQPSDLGAAVPVASDSFLSPVSLHCSPHQSYESFVFDVELTAEVRVEDGSTVSLLSSVVPGLRARKSAFFYDQLPSTLNRPSSARRTSQDCLLLNACRCPISPTLKNTDIRLITNLHSRVTGTTDTAPGAIQTAKSPLPSSPSTSPSSPPSAPSTPSSTPSSTSSSHGSTAVGYHNDDSGCVGAGAITNTTGDTVSSTSVSLAPPSLPLPPSSSNPSFHLSSTSACPGSEREDIEMYDPFHPTEGEDREGGAGKEEEEDEEEEEVDEEEGEKYDPFDPTGSPASERERERGMESERRSSASSVTSEEKESKLKVTPAGVEKKDRAPPDSTDLPVSAPLRHREEREQARSGGSKGARQRGWDRGKGRGERKEADSDKSEIEEGEIVAAGAERERERDIKRDRGGERVRSSGSPFHHACPKPERILRVLDGDGFVSVRAVSDWAVGMERDGGDLRRKLVSRRKERYRSCLSSSLSPPPLPPPLPSLPPSLPTHAEKEKSRKSSKSSKERERRKRKQDRSGEKGEKRKAKDRGSRDRKERDSDRDGMRGPEDKGKESTRGRSSHSDGSKRKKRRNSPKHSTYSYSQSSSLHQRQSRRSWSSPSEDRHRDNERDKDRRRDNREREREGESSRKSKRERVQESGSRERGESRKAKGSRERRDQERDRERERRRKDGRPVVPPSIQDLNGSDLFAIKRTITVTTTTTTTTVPGSPPLPQEAPDTPPQTSDKPRKKKRKRKRRMEEEEEEEPMSRSRDSSLTPLRLRGYDSDQFSDKLGAEVLSLDGEALDSDYPSLEDTPPPLAPPPPHPSPKPKSKPKTVRHIKKKSRPSKKASQAESSLRPKSSKSLSSLSPLSAPRVGATPLPALPPAKRLRKTAKDKGGKKEAGGRSGKSKKPSRGTRKGKLQSKVSVLVRDGVSSTTGGAGPGKLGGVVGSSNELAGQSGSSSSSSAAVVGGSIAVVFRRDNESRSPFLKPCSQPISISGRNKDFSKPRKSGTLALAPPSSSSSSSSSSSHLSVIKSKKVKPSSTTSASSSSASSPSSSSMTKRKRKQGKKEREYREKGGAMAEGEGEDANCSLGDASWGVLDLQSGSPANAKPSSPPPRAPVPTPSSSSTSLPPASSSPPQISPLPLPPSRDTRESTPDSQTVDSSCKTPEAPFLSEDGSNQTQSNSLAPPSNAPSSPPSLQATPGIATGIAQSTPDHKLPPDELKAPTSPPCSSSSSNSVAASLSLSLPPASTDPSSSSSSSVSSSSTNKPQPPPPPPPVATPLPWSLQTGVDCTAGGVLALTALLFKMEEANLASRAKAQEFIQATSQILSQANQSQSQHVPQSSSSSSSSSSQVPPLPTLAQPAAPASTQFILHSSLPLVGCTKNPPTQMHPGLSLGAGCAQTPPSPLHGGPSGTSGIEVGWENESKDPEKYLKKLHTQERAVEEVKLAIKPYYQRKDINKDEYKDILRKAVHKICHSRTGEINPVKVSNLVKLYVQRYKYFRKHGRRMDEEEREGDREPGVLHSSS